MSADQLDAILGLTIKHDRVNKIVTFLCALSIYSEDDQFSLSYNAPSSTGKSYIPIEIAKLFPKEDVIQLGYCSPTAFFHDVGEPDETEKGRVIVDLSRRLVVFLDQPHNALLERLRPLLSHDAKTINIKITDKSQKQGLRTKNVIIKGYPSVIAATALLRVYGRLKQGIYPLPAPVGYLDTGRGNLKEPDPIMAPLIRRLFNLYGSGKYSLRELVPIMADLGLRNKRGGKVTKNGISTILNNPFYIGVMRLSSTGEAFDGKHDPLISVTLYKRVQNILTGKTNSQMRKHEFLFRKLIRCSDCKCILTGERQKGYNYYRCHTKGCPSKTVREEVLNAKFKSVLEHLTFSDDDITELEKLVGILRSDWVNERANQLRSLRLQTSQLQSRLDRLTDAYLDQDIDRTAYTERRTSLMIEKKKLDAQHQTLIKSTCPADRVSRFFERLKSPYLGYFNGLHEEKRQTLEMVTSNRFVSGENLYFDLYSPFQEIVDYSKSAHGCPQRDRVRTLKEVLAAVIEYVLKQDR